MKELKIKCCHCKAEFSYYESEFRPFCREKCKMIDLGCWFDESYQVSGRDNSVYIEDSEIQIDQFMNDGKDEDY